MERKLKDILAACFAGGVVTTLLALIAGAGPLGLVLCALAGAAAGYLAYRPMETWHGVTRAARATFGGVVMSLMAVHEFFAKPRVLFWATMLMCVGTATGIMTFIGPKSFNPVYDQATSAAIVWICIVFVTWGAVSVGLVLTLAGANEIRFRNPWLFVEVRDDTFRYTRLRMDLTFGETGVEEARVVAVEVWSVWSPMCLDMLRVTVGLIAEVPHAVASFVVTVYRAIHRQARVMCMVDGPLGGVLAYVAAQTVFRGDIPQDPLAQLAVAFLGGFAGVVVGYANLKLVDHFWPETEAMAS